MSAYLSALESIYLPAVVIFSLLVGSFLNVVIHRLPIIMVNSWRREALEFLDQKDSTEGQLISLSQPRSRCRLNSTMYAVISMDATESTMLFPTMEIGAYDGGNNWYARITLNFCALYLSLIPTGTLLTAYNLNPQSQARR